MNKKFIASVLLVGQCLMATSVMAEVVTEPVMEISATTEVTEETTTEEMAEVVEAPAYGSIVGEITEISEEEGLYKVLVGDQVAGTYFVLSPSTSIIDAATLQVMSVADLQVGQNISVVISQNAPMTMSLPAICTEVTAVVVNAADKNVAVGHFDETLTDMENMLQLNIDETTSIQNTRGERRRFVAEDVAGQNAIVVYTTSTRSLPAQTVPEYVMIIAEEEAEVVEVVEEAVTEEVVMTEEENRVTTSQRTVDAKVALRDVAKELGYKIAWDNTTKAAVLTKGDDTIKFTVGQTQYVRNTESVEMTEAVTLENGTVSVSSSVVEGLK